MEMDEFTIYNALHKKKNYFSTRQLKHYRHAEITTKFDVRKFLYKPSGAAVFTIFFKCKKKADFKTAIEHARKQVSTNR